MVSPIRLDHTASMFDILPPILLLFAFGITFLGGFVKGAVGFAMPLIMISGLGMLIDPKLALAGIIIPILISNIMQVALAGLEKARDAVREHWRYIVLVCVMILVSAQFVTRIAPATMFFVLGVPVVILSLVQLAGWHPQIGKRQRRAFEWATGILSGVLGGLSGTWGPTTTLYLLALRTPRDRQMAVQGVIFGLGSVMLFFGHVQSGILNRETFGFSALLVVPALIGMWIGNRFGDRLDQDRFRKATLLVLVVAGLNLIRRGFALY